MSTFSASGTMIAATEISGVAISDMTRKSCSATAPPFSIGAKSSLYLNRSARLVISTPAIIADRKPGSSRPASLACR